jgi:NADH dehydrogenase
MKRVVIIGGGYAGLMAATRLTRLENATVTLIDQKAAFSQRVRMHELLAGSHVPELPYAPALAKRAITFKQASVEGIMPERQEIMVRTGAQHERLGYDSLLIALGSTTATDLAGVREHTLRLDNPQEIRSHYAHLRELAGRGGRVLVVGGGLTGIEAATELATRLPGLAVSLATSGIFAAGYNPATQAYLRDVFARSGITIIEQASIHALSAGRAYLSDARELAFDACVWTGGFTAPQLLREMGLAVDAQGRAFVTPELHVPTNPSIFIAGDSAAFGDANSTIRTGCATAMPMGVQAATNLRAQLENKAMHAHNFAFTGQSVSLGRKEGLVYKHDPQGRLTEPMFFGRAGALVKAAIIEWTWASVRYDRSYGIPIFAWPRGGKWWGQTELAQ